LAALHWISRGHGYEITGGGVLDAYSAVTQAAAGAQAGQSLMRTILGSHFSN